MCIEHVLYVCYITLLSMLLSGGCGHLSLKRQVLFPCLGIAMPSSLAYTDKKKAAILEMQCKHSIDFIQWSRLDFLKVLFTRTA